MSPPAEPRLDPERLAGLIADELRARLDGRAIGEAGCDCPPERCAAGCAGAHCAAHCPDKVRRLVARGAERISAGPGVGACDNVLARMIDHTLLAPDASRRDVEALCDEALAHCFATVCVHPWWVRTASRRLADSPVGVCTVVGFPLGANRTDTKVYEAVLALDDGAGELDMVLNVGALKSGAYSDAEADIAAVARAAREAGPRRARVKVILETALLTDEEKVKAAVLARAAGADFVKTSTGFGPGGATEEDVALLARVVGGQLGVKASGGVKDQPTALRMIEAGATRIGASAGIRILRGNGAGGADRPYGTAPAGPAVVPSHDAQPGSTTAPRATIHRLG